MPVNILDDHNGIINQHSDCKSNTGKADNIEISPHDVKYGEGTDNTDGYRQPYNSCSPQTS